MFKPFGELAQGSVTLHPTFAISFRNAGLDVLGQSRAPAHESGQPRLVVRIVRGHAHSVTNARKNDRVAE